MCVRAPQEAVRGTVGTISLPMLQGTRALVDEVTKPELSPLAGHLQSLQPSRWPPPALAARLSLARPFGPDSYPRRAPAVSRLSTLLCRDKPGLPSFQLSLQLRSLQLPGAGTNF